ncbi:Alpha/Beta hydrolase protein, partial [Roridomyces roridus]
MLRSAFTRNALKSTIARRRISTTVDLTYTSQFPASANKTEGAIIILHGLFGSARNWGAHSRAFARNLNRPVYALDLRNHGASPHAEPMTYSTMADDVAEFIRKHGLKDVSLIGHSMGGKAAMSVALSPAHSNLLEKLIVVDIAPSRGALSSDFKAYVDAMQSIESAGVSTRKEALEILEEVEKNPDITTFLLTNLLPSPSSSKFRIPINILARSIDELGSFPYPPEDGDVPWDGQTLFIKGTKSKYINRRNLPIAEKLFPGTKVEEVDSGHWVHSERPIEFGKLVEEFVGPI